ISRFGLTLVGIGRWSLRLRWILAWILRLRKRAGRRTERGQSECDCQPSEFHSVLLSDESTYSSLNRRYCGRLHVGRRRNPRASEGVKKPTRPFQASRWAYSARSSASTWR